MSQRDTELQGLPGGTVKYLLAVPPEGQATSRASSAIYEMTDPSTGKKFLVTQHHR